MSMSRRRLATAVAVTGAMLAAALPSDSVAEAGDEAAVMRAVEGFRKAMLANDRTQFEALCAPQMSYGHSAGKIQTKAEFIADASSGKSTWKSLDFSDVKNSVAGGNAISRFMLTGETESEGKTTAVKIGVLMVWQKQEDAWKLLARQAFRV
jgi:ketosteroid isomerase-like protein